MNSSVRRGNAVARKPAASVSNEDRLIARHFKQIATSSGALGLTDDAAAFRPPAGHDLVLTVDAIVGGVHFFPDDPPDAIARKALRVNLSDLAAKGARPAGFLLTLALPKVVNERWLKTFARALGEDARRYGCPLLGGDTVTTPGPLMASVMAFGLVPSRGMVRRAGARVGDHILVSGTVGDAALGLVLRGSAKRAKVWQLSPAQRRHLLSRYLVPQPRNALASAVRKYATAAMDVSDGLAGDLAKLCRVSGVAAVVDTARVPLSAAAIMAMQAEPVLMSTALSGGDDYEIVCTVRPARLAGFRSAARAAGVPVTDIGRIVRGSGTSFRRADGSALTFKRAAFSHF
jgi:thiamine-monophosphate kinase